MARGWDYAKLSLSNAPRLSFSCLCILLFLFLSLCRFLCVCVFLLLSLELGRCSSDLFLPSRPRRLHLFVRLPDRFDLHHRPRCTRWRHAHGLYLLRRYGQREGSAHLYDDFHHLSEPLRRSRDYAGVIRVQHAPHRTTNVVISRLRSHRRRRFLQVHQLSEDGRFLTEPLENNSQYGCEEDVEQQRGQHASLP